MKTRCARVLAVVLVLVLFALCTQLALGAGTIVVDTLVDEADGSCGDGDCSLRDAINVAASGDTIEFSVAGTIAVAEKWNPFVITKELTINGPGIDLLTISGADHSGVFWVQVGGVATITGMTIVDGYADGAAARSEGTLYLSDCVASGHYGGDGGAILNNGGVMHIANCTFFDNESPYGGAIDNLVGGALTVTNSIIVSNTADYYGGGLLSWDGVVVVQDTIFMSNTAGEQGGAVWNLDLAVVEGSTFLNNVAAYGGGVYNKAEYSEFLTGTGQLLITNSTLSGNVAITRGGGIDSSAGGVVTLTNCTIVSNTVYGIAKSGVGSSMTAINTIVADNGVLNCEGGLTGSSTNNLSTDRSCSPGFTQVTLGELALGDLQGNPPHFPLLEGSVAIDAGTNTGCPATDQRGVPRPQDPYETGTPICDVGSYEVLSFGGIYLPLVLTGGT
jgi:CSLREA domain-containing protein